MAGPLQANFAKHFHKFWSPDEPNSANRNESILGALLKPGLGWHARLLLHLTLAGVPILAISAHVFWSVSLLTVAWAVMLPLAAVMVVVVLRNPHNSDRHLLAGLVWGFIACAGYDAFRIPTVYIAHWWNDFFPAVGGWATDSRSDWPVGYLWRYVGDGGGIGVVFFALAGTLRASRWRPDRIIAFAVTYAVTVVWAGLMLTDLLAAPGHALFPLSAKTAGLFLIGHLIFGTILGVGYCKSCHLEIHWPLDLGHLAERSPVPLFAPRQAPTET